MAGEVSFASALCRQGPVRHKAARKLAIYSGPPYDGGLRCDSGSELFAFSLRSLLRRSFGQPAKNREERFTALGRKEGMRLRQQHDASGRQSFNHQTSSSTGVVSSGSPGCESLDPGSESAGQQSSH
jgi:hypothetical protein